MKTKPLYSTTYLSKTQSESREIMMADLGSFVAGVAPYRMLGHCHKDMLRYFCNDDDSQLILWPRGHQKSTLLAFWCAWWVVKHPDTSILYASATAELAELQLGLIKQILESKFVKKYWPELYPEASEFIWRNNAITTGHWKRSIEGMRDYTVKAVGVGGTITGQHYDVILLDDLVEEKNSEGKTERGKVSRWFSFLTSIINDAGITKAVGTRYHPKDLYDEMMSMEEEIFDEVGTVIAVKKVFTVSAEVVETDGQFLWPRQQRHDGRWFGFDLQILAKKKAKYSKNPGAYYSQYYNDPTDPETKRIKAFNYYKKEKLQYTGYRWTYEGRPLNVVAAIDFAATITKRAAYTAIVVIGIDWLRNIYVLGVVRFKTDQISEMTKQLSYLYTKWHFTTCRCETTGQQNLIVEQIKRNNKDLGIHYKLEKNPPCTDKRIRIFSNLEPLYSDEKIFHYRGGNCEILESELHSEKPPHIDTADALAAVVEIAKPPTRPRGTVKSKPVNYNNRFGGVA